MEDKFIKKKQMDDSKKNGIQKKNNNFAINISKGGGIGIGVGIILVGGALLVNVFQRKSPKKPIKKNNLKTSAQITYDQHLNSDGAEKPSGSGVSREISAQKLLQDGNHKFEGSHGKEDHLNCDDDQEIPSFSKDSENQATECNGSVVETGEEEANVTMRSSIEVNSGLIDHDDQETCSNADTAKHGEDDDPLNLESIEDSKINEIPEAAHEDDSKINAEIFVSENEEKGSLNIKIIKEQEMNGTFDADQGDEVKITGKIQTCEGIETKGQNQPETPCPEDKTAQYDGTIDEVEEAKEDQEAQHEVQIDGAGGEIDVQDSNNGRLTTSDVGVSDKIELLEEPKIEEEPEETPKLEEKEAEFDVQTNAETEAIEENKAQDSAFFNAAGEAAEEKEIQHDVQTNEVGEAAENDSSSEHTSKLIERQVIEEAIEDKEEKETQHDVHTNAEGEAAENDSSSEHTSKLIERQEIEEAIEDREEKETQHDVHTNAEGEAAEINSSIEHTGKLIECQVIEDKEEKEVVHDVHINAAADINSGSKKSSELIEIQTILDQDHSLVSHQITSDNILRQENNQNISLSELSILLELNPAIGLKSDSKDVGIDLHSIEPATEKDIICDETDELSQDHLVTSIVGENLEGRSQSVIVHNVEESSEGSVHEVPMQVKDQTEKLQENGEHITLQKTEKEIHYKNIEDGSISSEIIQTVNIEKGISNMNFLKKYMVKLAEQNDEKMSLLMRKKGPIVIGTMSALLGPLCYSYFGIPFLKIFLIAVLVVVLSKIQGF